MIRRATALVAGLGAAATAALAAAQEPGVPARFERDVSLVASENPSSFVDVVDAFDGDDPFDLHVRFGFEREIGTGTLERETGGPGVWAPVAEHRRLASTLWLGADLGVFRDLALRVAVPVVLSDVRRLQRPDGVSRDVVDARLEDPDPTVTGPDGQPGAGPLLSVPFTSDERSGVPHLALGVAWGVLNQYRDLDVPTLVLQLEGRFAVSDPMRPCAADPPPGAPAGTPAPCASDGPGIGDGNHGLRADARIAWRTRWAEAYGGLAFDASWPARSRDLYAAGGHAGYADTLPPRVAELTAGVAIVPWEDPGRFQRVSIDARFRADWVSRGLVFSPLFDALGTSAHGALATPRAPCAGCAADVPFTGLTAAEAHGRLSAGLAFELRAARYVRFSAGASVRWASPHALTGVAPCNDAVSPGPSDPRAAGCEAGIADPRHRPTIDLPGQRFRLVGDLLWTLSASAVAQF